MPEEKSETPKYSKEDFSKDVSAQLSDLRAHAQTLSNLCESLNGMASRGGDVAITSMKDAKAVSESMKSAKEALEKIRKAMKQRLAQVNKEL